MMYFYKTDLLDAARGDLGLCQGDISTKKFCLP